MHLPDGDWTKALTDAQRDLAERLMQEFELKGLDTRDRDLARHAIYYAMLFPAAETSGHRFGSPPEPVVNPSPEWCDRYAEWYYQGKG